MNDLLTVFYIIRKHKFKFVIFLVFMWFCIYLYGGEKLEYVSVSPDMGYRLEYYTPRRYQLLINLNKETPTFVRLYNNHNNRYFGESQVVDFRAGDAAPIWNIEQRGKVAVGMSIYYENIPPLSPEGKELPIPE